MSRPTKTPGLVLRLAAADLLHEWILTLCLVLAIAAVLSPLLLLFGLKYGTIETLRYRLIQDPRNREIRPLVSRTFARDWFVGLRERPGVGFVVPQTRQIAAGVSLQLKGSDRRADADLVPTDEGDALILENGAPIPGGRECVLSAPTAEALGARPGDIVTVGASRLKGSRLELSYVDLAVAGVLSLRAGAVKSIYVRLELLESVEQYKDGMAVPDLGWPGTTPKAYPVFDGVMISSRAAMSKVEQYGLCNNTGFTKIEELDKAALQRRTGLQSVTNRSAYLLYSATRPAGEDSLQAVRQKLRGRDVVVLPWVRPITATLSAPGAAAPETIELFAAPDQADEAARAGLAPCLTGTAAPPGNRLLLARTGLAAPGGEVTLTVSNGTAALELPVRLVDGAAPTNGFAFVPASLAGLLRLSQQRELAYEPGTDAFLLRRRGYAGFRLYARSIDDVDALRLRFEDDGIPVSTQAEKIRTVRELDHYLTLIFWLIAAVGIVGSAASLLASLYASVERKKRELGVLRLLGLAGGTLFRFPIYQGAIIAASGYGVAFAFFHGMSWTINTLFHAHLQAGESFCRLPAGHVAAALAGTVLCACFSALVAVARLARIDPAEALRDE